MSPGFGPTLVRCRRFLGVVVGYRTGVNEVQDAVGTAPVEVTPAGHRVEVWQPTIARAEVVDLPALTRRLGVADGARLVVIAAHPDDETLGAGRLVAEWSRTHGPVTAVLATLGEACVDHVMVRPADLEMRRLEEWRRATTLLGVSEHRLLQQPDGQLSQRQTELELRLTEALRARIAAGERLVLTTPWRQDPHPDHRACGRVAARTAARLGLPLLEYPVWMTYWLDPAALDGQVELARLAVDPTADEAQQSALDCYASQLHPLAAHLTPVVPPAMLEHHRQQLVLTPREARR